MIDVSIKKTLQGSGGAMRLDVNFSISPGSVTAITGPSGAGKTSILKMLAGLMKPDAGIIKVDQQEWFNTSKKIDIPVQKRNIGLVFQQYALFPNMRVEENLRYALQHKEDEAVINNILQTMDIRDLRYQYPSQLSGGQQQRVALARAIVRRPKILLLDEPFAALDKHMRMRLQQDLIRIHQEYQTTTLLVSHDMSEVARMADNVIEMDDGKIRQQSTPTEVLPKMPVNKIQAQVTSVDVQNKTITVIFQQALGQLTVPLSQLLNLKKGDFLDIPIENPPEKE